MDLPELVIGDLVIPLPIVQGGMGVGISLSGLASAVANEGGIGVIATAMIGFSEPDIATNSTEANNRSIRREIRKAREKTDGIIGVNCMVALTAYEELVKTSIEEGVDIVFSGAGLPLNLPAALINGSRTKLVPIVSSGRAATIICKKWWGRYNYLPDALVVEGPKAGGHIGFKPEQIEDPAYALDKLVVEVIEAVRPFQGEGNKRIPIIAAGGIYTGEDMYRILKLGADAVQMGTRFVATHECDADDAFKQTYIQATEADMTVIHSPVGLPGRAVHNDFLDQVDRGEKIPFVCPFHCLRTCDPEKSPYCIARALANARKGKFGYGFAFAGKNAYRVTEIISVKELIDSLKTEFSRAANG